MLSTCIEMGIVCFRKPLVSGYYKLLAVSMKIANKLNYFQVRIKTCTSIGVMMFEVVKFCIRIFLTYSVFDFWRKATIRPKNESKLCRMPFLIDSEIFVNEFFSPKIIL